ncbi:uncharacterized protein LOC110443163 [Mizuhopecten yessoensis]|uniref:Spaetzle domain-containing protein n=1 Tax=Mizuhopecten yessoensis TaxID=6573 RepID=A0A210PFM4_MIZYE|nr:uncharacterized protein LOC110443163 [Mizuhopecten yessoensis]OWF35261.1 hypothetical protein KP79_PYT15001 [Mizuhopecten yessoensis]
MNISVSFCIVWLLSVLVSEVNLTAPVQRPRLNTDLRRQQHAARGGFRHPLLRRQFNYRPATETIYHHGHSHTYIPRLTNNVKLSPQNLQNLRVKNNMDYLPRWVIERFPQGRNQRQYGFCDKQYGINTMLPEITKLFPGRFMSERSIRDSDRERRHRRLQRRRDEQWEFNPTSKIRDTSTLSDSEALRLDGNTVEVQRSAFPNSQILDTNIQRNTDSNILSSSRNQFNSIQPLPQASSGQAARPMDPRAFRCEPTCCDTEKLHVVYENVTINNTTYSVINLEEEKQFINVGFCPDTNTCGFGSCFQHYSTQYIAIWNITVDYWPPVDLAAHEFPSHCSWIG